MNTHVISTFKRLSRYRVAVLISSLSLVFGIFREFLVVGLLGFTAKNDELQLYLSIFYTIGLTIDAMRLACLNLYSVMSLPRLLLSASIIALPFACLMGLIMDYSTGGLDSRLLAMTIIGSYLNLIAALLITYKQRNNSFLPAQIISVLPNFILIPGILMCYAMGNAHLVFSIVALTSLIPIFQCILLLCLPEKNSKPIQKASLSLLESVMTFIRHFSVMLSDQFFQIITRTAFFNYGAGYLSFFAIAIRIYTAARFILVDSFIGSKLASWSTDSQKEDRHIINLINFMLLNFSLLFISLLISVKSGDYLFYSGLQVIIILFFGFYFSTLVRILYFKMNHYENNPQLVIRFAGYEFTFLLMALLLTKQVNYPILTLLWLGYVAKPFGQLFLLRKRYHGLMLNYGNK